MELCEYLIQQYDYVRWADLRCIDAARSVPAENLRRDYGFSFRTVHDTLAHMLAAQNTWVGRWKGDSARPFLAGSEFESLDAIAARWVGVQDELLAFVRDQTDSSLQQRISYLRRGEPTTGVLWQLINHCADHSNFHRGQLNSLIKLAGGTPASTMYVDWCRQQEGQL